MEGGKMTMIEDILKREMMMLEDVNQRLKVLEGQQRQQPPRQQEKRIEWSSFETDLILDDIKEIVIRRSMQFGRSGNSVMWKMWREIGKLKI